VDFLLGFAQLIKSQHSESTLIDVEGRIVGGVEVAPAHKYPFQVYISAGGYACGGSILDNHHILTAAHCLYDYDGKMHKPSESFVYVGAHDRPGGRCGDNVGRMIQVEEFILRPDYDKQTFENDLAILRYNKFKMYLD